MHEMLVIFGTLLGCIISYFTINKFVFYTKSEVDQKLLDIKMAGENRFNDLKDASDKKDQVLTLKMEKNHAEVKEELNETKEMIFEKLLEAERASNKSRQELYDRLSANKEVFEDYNKNMLAAMAEIKQDENEMSNNFITLLNAVKDELKDDYVNRYNDLLTIIGTKANVSDFDRLETKFDKVTETLTELKTIVQLQLEKQSEK